jgi:RNA polymerase sigma factor (sigma-70 family)
MEIAIVSKAKNSIIYRHMAENRLTLKDLARGIGVDYVRLSAFMNFRWIPTGKRRRHGDFIDRIEQYFHLPFEAVLPLEVTREIADRLSRKRVNFIEAEFVALQDVETKYISYDQEERWEEAQLPERIKKALSSLTEKEADIVRRRFGIDPYERQYTLREIAEHYHVTTERIRQVEARALKKLQHKNRRALIDGTALFPQAKSEAQPVNIQNKRVTKERHVLIPSV